MTYFVTELSAATAFEAEPIGWILSDIMAKANTLILLDMSSHAKMAPDTEAKNTL
jgi:hypothetical protein